MNYPEQNCCGCGKGSKTVTVKPRTEAHLCTHGINDI